MAKWDTDSWLDTILINNCNRFILAYIGSEKYRNGAVKG